MHRSPRRARHRSGATPSTSSTSTSTAGLRYGTLPLQREMGQELEWALQAATAAREQMLQLQLQLLRWQPQQQRQQQEGCDS